MLAGADSVALFGQTEMSPVTCVLEGKDAPRKLGSVGRPAPGVWARVVGPDMEDVAPGEVGEIVYRGPGTMLGYWNNPEATAEAFAGGWFHSGDLVRVDDEGFVYVVDRAKDMIISGGENIYCAEVENVLAGHPGHRRGRRRSAARTSAGARRRSRSSYPARVRPLDLEEVRAWASERLARYKLPTVLEVVRRAAAQRVGQGHQGRAAQPVRRVRVTHRARRDRRDAGRGRPRSLQFLGDHRGRRANARSTRSSRSTTPSGSCCCSASGAASG